MSPRAPDACFADPVLAELYDLVDGPRDDLDPYVALAAEVGARRVLDVGCGTGVLALRLAAAGHEVVAVEPAAASLDVARRKPGAEQVRWVHAAADEVPDVGADLAVMTANVAQVFLDDDELGAALDAVRAALAPGGWFAFESRAPAARACETWVPELTTAEHEHPVHGRVRTWIELTSVALPLVSFRHSFAFLDRLDRPVLGSDSTLCFRDEAQLRAALDRADLATVEVRGAPDRPGRELVVLARRTDRGSAPEMAAGRALVVVDEEVDR